MNAPATKVVIIDDHPLFTNVLKDVLAEDSEYAVVGVAQRADDALEVCAKTEPNLVLVDIMMPGVSGLELLVRLREVHRDTLLVAVSGLTTKEAIHMALSMGANAFIPKTTSIEELLRALKSLRAGKAELTPEEAAALRWAVREQRAWKTVQSADVEVLRLFSQGKPVKEIADQTGRTPSAIYKTLHKNKRRFEVRTDWELRLAAMRLGLTECRE
ncbi:MAG: response regulator transcription factor [Verrucomicrobia bacterium]|nr:response regulator transcription factor [Verrucomicrobiota bacterium]